MFKNWLKRQAKNHYFQRQKFRRCAVIVSVFGREQVVLLYFTLLGFMADENKLPRELQIFIVEYLACYRTSKQIIEKVKELFDVILTKQQIYYYEKLCHKKLKNKATKDRLELEKIFDERRKDFKKKVEDIPGFNISFRVQTLNDMLIEERDKLPVLRRDPLILQIMEQLAKEQGGMFTNKRELSGKDGKPLMPEELPTVVYKDLLNAGWTSEDAAKWVSKHYNVDESKVGN